MTAPFNGQGQFERIAHDRRLKTLLFGKIRGLPLFTHAGLADAEDRVPAVLFLEIVLQGRPADEIFDLPRWKLDRRTANIANEVQMVRLTDDRLIVGHSMQL